MARRLKVKLPALALVTAGLLGAGGSLLARATHGRLLPDIYEDIPVVVLSSVGVGGGGGQYISYFAEVPEHYKYISRFVLVLDPQTHAWLSKREPLRVKSLEPTKLRGHFDSRDWTLRLLSETEWQHFDAAEDEEELILLWAVKWLLDDDDGFIL